MASKQDQAIAAANALIGIMGSFKSLRQQVNDFVANYNSEGWSTLWNNLATAVQNADGAYGAADGTPNTSHPIDTRVITTLSKGGITATQLVNAVAMLQAFQAFLTNAAVATANRNQNVDDLAS